MSSRTLGVVLLLLAGEAAWAFTPTTRAPPVRMSASSAECPRARAAPCALAGRRNQPGKQAERKRKSVPPARGAAGAAGRGAAGAAGGKKPLETKYIVVYSLVAFGVLYDFFVTHGGKAIWDGGTL
ncbi:hypothetical protein KFE25_011044 [Diacronema lutheri]|uniref:Uncharacterized protein n=1 Tax=Diacronema lutheri TaxID=2081491 RepID=A0A8J6C7P7_DIALT|nr:hypothetical protein KFE25_011044 [Diacronema lutheri]